MLNIEPVIPLHLTKKWNLITRTILPIIWQPDTSQPTGQGWYGLGDLNPTLFLLSGPSRQIDLGCGARDGLSHRFCPTVGSREGQPGSGRSSCFLLQATG